MATDMDVLVMENTLLFKDEQPAPARGERAAHLSRFEPD
jgi:hypothetical protein